MIKPGALLAMEYPTTVNLASVFRDAVRVKVEDLKPGDRVFDTFGQSYALTRVVPFVKTVRLAREDGVVSTFDYGDSITVLKGA